MDKPRILSWPSYHSLIGRQSNKTGETSSAGPTSLHALQTFGELIVAKGKTNIDATLPVLGLKDTTPNGSWLEQKQIQAALEARKHLIEVERIEKCGTLSHAEWREDAKLAEVTQKAGGYWQYFGHNVGKKLYLNPEEALFLIELNCLQLKHNDVTVSLQKAYTLLLHETVSIIQYKVYASLSRLGYKVFRHKVVSMSPEDKTSNESEGVMEVNDDQICINSNIGAEYKVDNEIPTVECENKMDCEDDTAIQPNQGPDPVVYSMEEDIKDNENHENNITNVNSNENVINERDTNSIIITHSEQGITTTHDTTMVDSQQQPCYVTKLKKLRNRQLKPTDSKTLHKYFECIPDLFQKQVITINVPEQEHLPKNVFVNKSSYMLSLETIRMKSVRTVSTESATYSVTDEVNGDHVRRIRGISTTDTPQNANPFRNSNYPRQSFNCRQFNFWRPHNNLNYYHYGMFYQRPYFQNMYFMPRFQFGPHSYPNVRIENLNRTNARNRSRNLKTSQLQGIKALAARFKQLIMSGNTQIQNIQALRKLLHTYNLKYKTRLRLTDNFDVINDETIIETIELEDEGESKNKRPRLDDKDNTFNENLNRLRHLALKLKELENKKKATARKRRAFSNAIKTFNKSYNSDVYLNSTYEVIDKRHITLDSSSESDCVVEEAQTSSKGNKLLRNPFNLIKRLSGKINSSSVSTSKDQNHNNELPEKEMKYNENIKRVFNKNWLPIEEDFGRAEVPTLVTDAHFTDSCKEDFLFHFMNEQNDKYKNWLEVKISFLKHIENGNIAFQQNKLQNDVQEVSYTGLRPLIGTEDCLDMPSVLEKLRIIKNNKEINTDTSLRIYFDVYNRDVHNFRKTNPPKPHFRVVCINETTRFPPASEVATLYSKYEDNVPIAFAAVGASVAYLQINPTDMPIYIPNNDIV